MTTGWVALVRSAGLAASVVVLGTLAAHADGMDAPKGKAAAAEPPKPDYTIAYNVGASSNYVFRGISQSDQGAAVQGGIDFTYKWLYLGVWSSSIDFGQTCGPVFNKSCASDELDVYGGFKFPVHKTWNLDVGVITYNYPHSLDTPLVNAAGTAVGVAKWDYYEGKVNLSGNITEPWTAGVTAFYSPKYTGGTGKVWTFEGTTAYTLPKWHQIEPSLSATLGYQAGNNSIQYLAAIANGSSDYLYWNAGITFTLDKLALDLRYWDTNINSGTTAFSPTGNYCDGTGFNKASFQCGAQFSATVKYTF